MPENAFEGSTTLYEQRLKFASNIKCITVFYKLFFWKKAVLLQIYISIKQQLSYGTVFLDNIISNKMPNKYTYCTVKKIIWQYFSFFLDFE